MMLTRRLPLLGIAAAFVLGACSSSGASTTATTPAPATTAAPVTAAPTTAAPTTTALATAAPSTSAAANAAANPATALVSQALVSKTGGKLALADATCIAAGMLAKYDLSQLAAMQTTPISAEVAAATAVIIETCVGADRAVEVGTLLAGSV
jgi:PBP1b-binding outer membrane lipoprotein LpoB